MEPDILVTNLGTIFAFRPVTDAGTEWLNEHTQTEPYQWFAGALAVEHRYTESLIAGIQEDGLEVAES